MKKNIFWVLLLLLPGVCAEEFSLGVITSYSPAVYKGLDTNIVPFPMVGYEGEHLFIRGTGAGYSIFSQETPLNIIFRVQYDPRVLKPEDSDDTDIQKLDERKAGVLGGMTFQVITYSGIFEGSVGSDIAFNHNGLYAQMLFKKPFHMGAWGFTPEIGYAFNDDRLNNHLYGVSSKEAERANLEEFNAGGSGEFFVGGNGYLYLAPYLRLVGSMRYSKLDAEIADSPIIRSDDVLSGTLGFAFIF